MSEEEADPDVPDAVAAALARLRKAARADKRADELKARTRKELREALIEASKLSIKPSKATREIEHHLSEGHVSRVMLGKA